MKRFSVFRQQNTSFYGRQKRNEERALPSLPSKNPRTSIRIFFIDPAMVARKQK